MNLAQKVKKLTAKEIIMAMVEGLRNPVTKIDMATFGEVRNGICYGCAATNAICKIGGFNEEQLKKAEGYARYIEQYSAEDEITVNVFESAINRLRQGNYSGYNALAGFYNFAQIKIVGKIELPTLTDNFTEADLSEYVKLADLQD